MKNKELMWGDEIEYSIVALDPETKVPRISLRAEEVKSYQNRYFLLNFIPALIYE